VDPHLLIPLPHVGLVPFLSQLGRPFPTFPQHWGLCIYILDKPCLSKLGDGSAIGLLNNDYGTGETCLTLEDLYCQSPRVFASPTWPRHDCSTSHGTQPRVGIKTVPYYLYGILIHYLTKVSQRTK
jgi:hypothetical protein